MAVCPFGANEVHVGLSSAMPHSMSEAVKCELCSANDGAAPNSWGHCSRVVPETAEVGLLIGPTMCFKVTFRV